MNLSSSLKRFNYWLQHSPQPSWLKLAIVVGAVLGVIFLISAFWWVFALIAVGYVAGQSRS